MGKSRLDDTTRDLIFGNLEDLTLSSPHLDNVRVWFNNKGWISSVSYMNAINNLVLRASIEARMDDFDYDGPFLDASKFGIAAINHPMNYTKDQLDTEIM